MCANQIFPRVAVLARLNTRSMYSLTCSRDSVRFLLKVNVETKYQQPMIRMSSGQNVNIQAMKGWNQSDVLDTYEQTRPDYNASSVEYFLQKLGVLEQHSDEFKIVELGAGTGKFTRAMLQMLDEHGIRNIKIVSTEPVGEMCKKFKEMVPNVEILQCPANDLGLESNSADAIIAAQCFHWFSNAESVCEINRVLKSQGILGIIWNIPDRSVSWIRAIEEMLDVSYRLHKIARPETKEWLRQINNNGGFGPLKENDSYTYSTEHSFDGLIERFKSISVVAAAEGEDKKQMLEKIRKEIKSVPDVGSNTKYTFQYIVEMKWFQKL